MTASEDGCRLVEEDLRRALQATDYIKPEWYERTVSAWLTLGDNERYDGKHLRSIGTLLTKEELKSRGLRAILKISHERYEALTEGHQADPLNAYRSLCHVIVSAAKQRRNAQFPDQSYVDLGVPVIAKMGWHEGCDAARQFRDANGSEFSPDSVPDLPLPGCALPICACQIFTLPALDPSTNVAEPDNEAPTERRRGRFRWLMFGRS